MTLPPPGFPFYPLANPKGTEYKCEVCSKPAYLQCSLCRVTYYCGTEHQRIDWVGIHEKICQSLMNIRKPTPFIASEDERRKKKDELHDKNLDMVSLTQLIGQKLLFQGKPEEAVPAALQCLKFTADAYGLASVELVSPYLILAESSIGLGRLCQAEAYLAQAQWTMMKTQHECSNAIRSQLHRKLGLLYAAKGDYKSALESLAKDIFYASCEFGTDHIRTAGGYFQMAEVFNAMYKEDLANVKKSSSEKDTSSGLTDFPVLTSPACAPQIPGSNPELPVKKILGSLACQQALQSLTELSFSPEYPIKMPVLKAPVADDLYARVVTIWADHLSELVRGLTNRPEIPEGIGAVVAEITQENIQTLDDAQKAEAEKILYAIEKYRMERAVSDGSGTIIPCSNRPDSKVQLYLALSMLNFVLDNKHKAQQYLAQARVAYEFAVHHPQLDDQLEMMKDALTEPRQVECVGAS